MRQKFRWYPSKIRSCPILPHYRLDSESTGIEIGSKSCEF